MTEKWLKEKWMQKKWMMTRGMTQKVRMKKKLFCLALGMLLLLFSGCGQEKEGAALETGSGENLETLKVVTSFYPLYIMAMNITAGVPGVEVVNMTEPTTGCLHDYQLTPGDMKNLEKAGIMIINGADMESFLGDVTKERQDLAIIDASSGLELLTDEGQGEPNPHLWVSISGAINQVENIGKQLALLDPDRAEAYQANTRVYIEKLDDLKRRMHETIDPLKNRDIVTFHEAFPYFAQEFDLNIKAVIQREPGSQPSAGELAQTIDLIRQSGLKVLFAEPQYGVSAAETIAQETGARLYYLDPAVTGPMEASAYLDIMEKNLQVLAEALK